MGEGSIDDLAARAQWRERGEMRMRPPPLGTILQREARAEKEHAAGRGLAERLPQRIETAAPHDLLVLGPLASPGPQRQRRLVRSERSARENDADEDHRRGRERRTQSGQSYGQRRRGERRAHEQRQEKSVQEPIGGKPEKAEGRRDG